MAADYTLALACAMALCIAVIVAIPSTVWVAWRISEWRWKRKHRKENPYDDNYTGL